MTAWDLNVKISRASHLCTFLWFLAFTLLLTGCETPFTPAKSVPPDKALVYLYRKYNYFGAGLGIRVYANGKPVTDLWAGDYFKGTYYPFICPPGDVLFEGKEMNLGDAAIFNFAYHKSPLAQIKVEGGKTYYLRLKWTDYNVLTGSKPALIQFDNAIGAQQITNCVLAKSLEPKNATPQ
jgi:hypothetical protein